MFSTFVMQLYLLTWCTDWGYVFSEGTFKTSDGEILYCYDNIFADIMLEGGNPSGIYRSFDMFTWTGWLTDLEFHIIYTFANDLILNLTIAVALAIVFSQAGLPLCAGTEKIEYFYFGNAVNLCTFLDW